LWIDYYHNTKRYKKSLGLDDTKANRKIAESEIIPEFVYKLRNGMFFDKQVEAKVPTVYEYAQKSFEIHRATRKKSTQYGYELAYRVHIEKYFGDYPLDKIKPSDIAVWQNHVLERVSARMLKNIRIVLNAIFEDAINDEIIVKNPISRVKLPKFERVDIKPFSQEEIIIILQSAKETYKCFYAIGFLTGMRTGEITALRWEDIDFENMTISIKRAIRMGVESSPKTANSYRVIDIIDQLVPYLKEQFEKTGHKNSYLFLTANDTPLFDAKSIRDCDWKTMLKRLKIEYRPLYHMRHSFASLMIANGEDILWVSNMLGHVSSKMTLDRYARYLKRDKKIRAGFLKI